jgi:hypothetical protein
LEVFHLPEAIGDGRDAVADRTGNIFRNPGLPTTIFFRRYTSGVKLLCSV